MPKLKEPEQQVSAHHNLTFCSDANESNGPQQNSVNDEKNVVADRKSNFSTDLQAEPRFYNSNNLQSFNHRFSRLSDGANMTSKGGDQSQSQAFTYSRAQKGRHTDQMLTMHEQRGCNSSDGIDNSSSVNSTNNIVGYEANLAADIEKEIMKLQSMAGQSTQLDARINNRLN